MSKPNLRTVSSDLPEPPYEATFNAGSFAFELDANRILQSKTWLMAAPEVRPWLSMVWWLSWTNFPSGSWDDDDEFIAARLGCSFEFFSGHRKQLMRGWVKHSDGRLYHSVITEKVQQIQGVRSKWRKKRQKQYRGNVSGDTLETPVGVSGESPPSSSSSSSSSSKKDTHPQAPAKTDEEQASPAPITATPEFTDVPVVKSPCQDRQPNLVMVPTASQNAQEQTDHVRASKKKTRPRKKPKDVEPPFEVPPGIDAVAWHEFEEHRKAIKKPLNNQARRMAAKKLLEVSKPEQINAVQESIISGWSGIFPKKKYSPPENKPTAARKRAF